MEIEQINRKWLDVAAEQRRKRMPVRHIWLRKPSRSIRTKADEETVAWTLGVQVLNRNNGLSRLKRFFLASCEVTYDDFCNVIKALVLQPHPGMLDIVLDMFFHRPLRSPKRHLFHRRETVSVLERRRYVGGMTELVEASEQIDIIDILCQKADTGSLQALLLRAMYSRNLDLMCLALREYADPNQDIAPWWRAVAQGDEDFIGAAITAPIPIADDHMSEALAITVLTSRKSITQLLLIAGADSNFNNAEAFELAFDTKQYEVVSWMLVSKKPPSSGHINRVVQRMQYFGKENLIEMLVYLISTDSVYESEAIRLAIETLAKSFDLYETLI